MRARCSADSALFNVVPRRREGRSLNITSRQPRHVEKAANDLVAHDMELASGYHRVTQSAADTLGKTALCSLNVSVADRPFATIG